MKFSIRETSEGNRWVKSYYNAETQKIETEEFPVGHELIFDPNQFLQGSDILVDKEPVRQQALNEDGSPMTLEQLLGELQSKYPNPKFQPHAWYNRDGDILHIYLNNVPHVVEHVNSQLEKLVDPKTREVVGIMVWGVKRTLLESL